MVDLCPYYYNTHEEKTASFSIDTIIALSAVAIAIFTIVITYRFQLLFFINAQLIEIAKTCNSYLQEDYQVHKDGIINRGRASGIVTALEDAEKIIERYYKSKYLIFRSDKTNFKKIFYDNIHSSIKVILKDVLIQKGKGFTYNGEDKYDPIRKDQLDKACEFFQKEINETWSFEKSREKRLGIT